jgi:tetratricopeptide (TPR) repeat protein
VVFAIQVKRMLVNMIRQIQAEWLFRRGRRRAAAASLPEGLALLERAAIMAPSRTGILLQQGRALIQAQDPQKAANVLQRAVERSPRNPATHLFAGIALFDSGDLEAAAAAFDAACRRSSGNHLAKAYRLLSDVAGKGGVTAACRQLLPLIDNADALFKSRLLVVCERLILSDHAAAARSLDDAVLLEMAGRRSLWDRFQEGLSSYWHRLDPFLDPRGKAAWRTCHKANRLLMSEDLPAAVVAYREALTHAPGFEPAGEMLLECLFCLKRFDEAEVFLREQENFTMLERLAAKPAQAPPPLSGGELELLSTAGRLFLHTGAFRKADRCFALLDDLSGDYYHIYSHGLSRLALGDTGGARECFRRATAMPGPHIARRRFEELIRLTLQDG